MEINPNLKFLRDNFDAFRICKHQGGTRSGKTYSILQFLIELCYLYPNAGMQISIVRKTLPALKATAYKDFLEILGSFGAYNEANHNKSDLTYYLNGNTFDFFSLDQSQKVRGRKRHVLYINEANEVGKEAWKQLAFRTSHKVIFDYNPSDPEHWLYDLDQREDCKTIVTTYKDNPFLTPGQIFEIEELKNSDPDYWNVFGLGQIGAGLRGRIFNHFEECDEMPAEYTSIYGLDWGYSNDPTALIEIKKHNNTIWLNEVIYKKGLTNSDIIQLCKDNNIKGHITADSAEPKSIEELRKAGLNIHAATKGPGSVNTGIDKLKALKVYYTSRSVNIKKEQLHYKWKLNTNDEPTNEPIDNYNHAIDAVRYAVATTPVTVIGKNYQRNHN